MLRWMSSATLQDDLSVDSFFIGITVVANSRARRMYLFVVEAAITEQKLGFEWVSADTVEDALDRVGFLLVAADVCKPASLAYRLRRRAGLPRGSNSWHRMSA